jgi:hypothetical protein
MRRVLNLCVTVVLLSAGSANAQGISIIQDSDGTSGTVLELGKGFRTYSDSHGNMGTIMDLGGGFQTYQFTSPHGGLQSGTILTLPSPRSSLDTSPAGLTPAPVLPFTPRGPLMPREQMAPVVPLIPNTGPFNTFGGGGRLGR